MQTCSGNPKARAVCFTNKHLCDVAANHGLKVAVTVNGLSGLKRPTWGRGEKLGKQKALEVETSEMQ